MVRVKYRYILAEIMTEQYKNKVKLPVNEFELKNAIIESVEVLHGDYGLACIQSGFSIKMYNAATRTFIARVRHRFHSVIASSLPFITSIGKVKMSVQTLRLSGTIRGTMKFLIKYDKGKLTEMVQTLRASAEMEGKLAEMIQKCHRRISKKRLDID